MVRRTTTIVSGVVLDESVSFSLPELCRCFGISAEAVIEMVDEGLIEPSGAEPPRWRFHGVALRRVQTALRLRQDLRVNLAGAALALDLMEELEDVRQRLRRLEQADAAREPRSRLR